MHEMLPPEILDRILDYLRGDNRSLSACALAARVMVPRTRYHRFRSVTLRPMHARSDLLPLLDSSPELTELVTSVRMVYLVNKEFEQELDVLARVPALTALTAVSTTNLLAFPWRSLATAASYAPALTSLHLIGPGLMLPEEGLSVLSRFHSLEEIRLRLVQFMDENPLEYFHSYARRRPAPASLRRLELRQADMNLVVGRWIQSTSPAPIMCSVRHYISDGMDANQFETMTEWWSGTVENLEVIFEPAGNLAGELVV
ncbi:hypothetical protein BD413DRAFT_555493, partial [Trametes elegans]